MYNCDFVVIIIQQQKSSKCILRNWCHISMVLAGLELSIVNRYNGWCYFLLFFYRISICLDNRWFFLLSISNPKARTIDNRWG